MVESLQRIERGSSARLLNKILTVLLPGTVSVLDVTWGHGKFWTPEMRGRYRVTGYDLDPSLAKDGVHDFTKLPDRDNAHDVVIFDPPYQTDAGEDSVIDARFGSYPSVADLKAAVEAGVQEAARVSRVGFVVKVMDHIHSSRLVRMTSWVEAAATPLDLYDMVYLESPSKIEDGRWKKNGQQLSVRSTATTWLVFRHDGPVHRRRRAT